MNRYQRSLRVLAALASSSRRTGVVTGASRRISGRSLASRAARPSAPAKDSSVVLDSVSVGSTISASSTTSGKYTVEGWNPRSITRFAISIALMPVASRSGFAAALGGLLHAIVSLAQGNQYPATKVGVAIGFSSMPEIPLTQIAMWWNVQWARGAAP